MESGKVEDGGPAFPVRVGTRQIGQYETEIDALPGMTLRDWFAAHCMASAPAIGVVDAQAIMGETAPDWARHPLGYLKWWAEASARFSYLRADAMLTARTGSAA